MATYPSLRKVLNVIRDPRLAAALLNAQVQLRGRARVPLSTRLRGKVHIAARGEVVFGEGITLVGNVVPIEFVSHKGGRILVGDHTFINYGSSISAHELVSIGRDCLLGHYTFIIDNNQHDLWHHLVVPPPGPVIIEDNAWIGSHSIILPGVRIGHNAVIGAGSVVSEAVPPWCVAVGNPARVVRRLNTCPGRAGSHDVGREQGKAHPLGQATDIGAKALD
jgi:maltose O-acetyltransferase